MLTAIVLVASIAAQLTAAALALRLIRVTGWRLAWSMIAVAMALMGVRRSITFYRLMTGDLSRPPELAAELLALAIALLMVAGVVLIASRFRAARRAEGALRESERQFRDFTDSASDWVWEMDADLRFSNPITRFKQPSMVPALCWVGAIWPQMTSQPDAWYNRLVWPYRLDQRSTWSTQKRTRIDTKSSYFGIG